MKNLRKLCAVLFAAVMLFSLYAVALAETVTVITYSTADSVKTEPDRGLTYSYLEAGGEKMPAELPEPDSPAESAGGLFTITPTARGTPGYMIYDGGSKQPLPVLNTPVKRYRVPLRI